MNIICKVKWLWLIYEKKNKHTHFTPKKTKQRLFFLQYWQYSDSETVNLECRKSLGIDLQNNLLYTSTLEFFGHDFAVTNNLPLLLL